MNSPFSWMTGTMWDEAREARSAMLGGTLASVGGAATRYFKGASAGFTALKAGANMWDSAHTTWRSWEQNHVRPRRYYEEWKDFGAPIAEAMRDSFSGYWSDEWSSDDGSYYQYYKSGNKYDRGGWYSKW